ncbi:MAG: hypothetical protein ABIG44_00050 [Planctomycetota bacterium]
MNRRLYARPHLHRRDIILVALTAALLSPLSACIDFPETLDPAVSIALTGIDPAQTNLDEVLDTLTDSQRDAGCSMQLLRDGESSFQAMVDLVAAAEDHINAETWAFDADTLQVPDRARALADLIKSKVTAGVAVNIITDPVFSAYGPREHCCRNSWPPASTCAPSQPPTSCR